MHRLYEYNLYIMYAFPEETQWSPPIILPPAGRRGGPVYLAVVQAMEAAIRDGELQAGDQLPPQRAVAELLGVDLTTVTRAYAAARARGLVEGAVGRGTFVRRGATDD